ncbi:hypothetical protein D3C84_1019630 [compost metagenome]
MWSCGLWGRGYGLNTLYGGLLERFHAFAASLHRQRNQFVKTWVVIASHEGFHQHRNVNSGDDLIVFFIDSDAASRIERAAAPGIYQEQNATASVQFTDFTVVLFN